MANTYNFSSDALLKRIGLQPGKKILVFLISLIAITIALGNVYNSLAVIFFVLYSVLASRRQDFSFRLELMLPLLLFVLMALSLSWSIDFKSTLKALGKEAALLFIPLAFMLNRKLSRNSAYDVLKNYSIGMCMVGVYFIVRAFIRYFQLGTTDVFFYHELSTFKINAIYLSTLFSLALFVFIAKKNKTIMGYVSTLFLLVMVFLLSSKNIIIIDVLLIVMYYLFFAGFSKGATIAAVAVFCAFALVMGYYGKIYDRLLHEMEPVKNTKVTHGVHNVSVGEAWHNKKFNGNDYFNGTAFRTYQIRIFKELLADEPILFTGYGLNASAKKIELKGIEHNLYHGNKESIGYNKLNFHNQYIEAFADLGIFGFLLLVAALVINLKNGIEAKYFVHIAFAILMISLFLTESFLWRQRGVVFFTLFYCLFNSLLPVNVMDRYVDKNYKKPRVAKA
jgi:O-antigen ligase